MKKLLYLTLILSFVTPCYASPNASEFKTSPTNPNLEYNSAVVVDKEIDGLDTLVDIPLRLAGFIQTVLGAGVFIGIAPITGLMTLYPPHTTINKAAEYLIVQPARYTFDRPVGDFNFDSRIEKKN